MSASVPTVRGRPLGVVSTAFAGGCWRASAWGVTALPFDPDSQGAKHLARDWLPELERWEMRVPDGHLFHWADEDIAIAGQTMEVGAPAG